MWNLGLLIIFAGIAANPIVGMILPAPPDSAAARGQAAGRAVATVLAIITGVVLVVVDLVRRNRAR
jgi:hypothetical protein